MNFFFAVAFCGLVPLGMLQAFSAHFLWMAIPFSSLVSWVFLTMDRIGDWSENPFEGLANDVPISTMSRGIERDILQMVGRDALPPPREQAGALQY